MVMANNLDSGASTPTNYGGFLQSFTTPPQQSTGSPYEWLQNQTFGQNEPYYKTYGTELGHAGDVFSSQFENLVGRAPTQEEQALFYKNWAAQNKSLTNTGNDYAMTQGIGQFVGTNFHKAAQDYAQQQLEAQQGQANSLADLFRSQGNAAISQTEQSLLDYQQKLFDRLRPNLMTSLKAQGLLDTGGLNEALAGQQGDLANQAANYVAQLKLQNEQGANQIAFGGASAPYYYKQQQITNAPGYNDAMGMNAMNFGNQNYFSNLDFQHNMALAHQQAQDQQGMQPSFLRTLGQSFAGGLGSSAGNSFGQWFKPPQPPPVMPLPA